MLITIVAKYPSSLRRRVLLRLCVVVEVAEVAGSIHALYLIIATSKNTARSVRRISTKTSGSVVRRVRAAE